MNKELTIVEARQRLTQLPEELKGGPGHSAITVTRRGRPVLAVMNYDLYDSIIETLEIMADPELMADLRESISQADTGQLISWGDIQQENGW